VRCYFEFFFSCLAAFFSFIVLAGFFLSLFFESMPLLMMLSVILRVVEHGVLQAKSMPFRGGQAACV
jgi:hypothetical protein